MCHYQVLPSIAGPSWGVEGGSLGVEGAEWISYEYSCRLPCTTKQKMAPQRETPPIKTWREWVGYREDRKGDSGESGKSEGRL